MNCWSPYISTILISLSVLLSLWVEIISQLRSPHHEIRYIFTIKFNFPIKDSRDEKIPIEASGGLYHITTTTGFDLGLRSPNKDFQGHPYVGHYEW